jgi:hypothetical protein
VNIKYGWYSNKQAMMLITLGQGCTLYETVNGTIAEVTEVSLNCEPSGNWDDYVFVALVTKCVRVGVTPSLRAEMPSTKVWS